MATLIQVAHHTAGGMSRTLPYLTELQQVFFCDVSPMQSSTFLKGTRPWRCTM